MLKASWVEPENNMGDVCPLFRKKFHINKSISSALLRVSARGVYEAVLNGRRVGCFVLAPGWTAYERRIQLQEYDITSLIEEDNTLTLLLAKGWYMGSIDTYTEDRLKGRSCAVIAELTLTYADGSVDIIGTDNTWQTSQSGLRFCDIYHGMIFDASFEADFCGNAVVSVNNGQDTLIPQQGPEIIENERLRPVEILHTPAGETVVDFGQNITGYPEISVTAELGDRIKLSFAEVLDSNGNFYNANYRTAKCLYEYICRDGQQIYRPSLTFYGFRYVRIDEFPVDIRPENIIAVVVHSELRQTGRITTSDPLLNKLFQNILWGQKGNYLDIPSDCPQRDERLGWTGDAQAFIRTACYNYDVRRFFTKWLSDMRVEQLKSGAIPDVIPAVFTGIHSPAWGDAVTICPWQLYMTYGDRSFLSFMFDSMKKWVDYITSVTKDKGLWTGGKTYGDWLELKAPKGHRKGYTRDELIATAFYAYSSELVCKAGRVLGIDISKYEELHSEIVARFKAVFEDDFRTQTEHILPLYFGLTDRPDRVAESLVAMIHADGDKLQTGFVGTPYLLHVLSNNGYSEIAYELLLRKDFPSWLYPVTKGATTMWEHWDGLKPNGEMWSAEMNSFNHYAYGAVGDWMYGVCAGINPVEQAPGFARVHFAPISTERIDFFRAELDTDHGKICSEWHHENGVTVYEITTPVPSTALIEGKNYELRAGVHRFENNKKVV